MKRFLLVMTLVAMFLLLVPAVMPQTVVQRVLLGNSVEGIAYIPTGPLAGHIVIIDNNQLIAFPAEGRGNAPWRVLFKFDPLGLVPAPRGVTYIASEHLLVFTDPVRSATSTFTLTDFRGSPKGTIVFTWPEDFLVGAPYVEGAAWIPLDAPRYAGCLVFAAVQVNAPYKRAFFVMDRQGNQVARIPAPPHPYGPDWDFYPGGLSYRNGHLLVGLIDPTVWELDLDGNILAGTELSEGGTVEGVAALGSGRIAVVTYASGSMLFLDGSLNRLPGERSFRVGLGLTGGMGIGWKADTSQFLFHSTYGQPSIGLPQIAGISADGKSSQKIVDLWGYPYTFGRLDYVSPEGLIAVPKRGPNPREILMFSGGGELVESVYLGMTQFERVFALTYVASTNQFATRRIDFPRQVGFFNRNGTFDHSVDLSALIPPTDTISDLAYFVPAGGGDGRLMVVAGKRLLDITLSGELVVEYSTVPLSVDYIASVKAITSGPKAGAWVGLDGHTNELLVFTLP